LADLTTVTQHQVDKARGILRELMGEQIVLHPTADGTEPYLTAVRSPGSMPACLGVTGKNKFGGGEGTQPSLTPLLRFEIQGAAFAA
jgi:hypothetical protein